MQLDLASSSSTNLIFNFVGGTNLNVQTDRHIHDAVVRWNEDGTLSSAWTGYSEGKPAGEMVFTLERDE